MQFALQLLWASYGHDTWIKYITDVAQTSSLAQVTLFKLPNE
jgi:hypothetical protein